MPFIKFLGELQEKYGLKKYNQNTNLEALLNDILDPDEVNNKYLNVLVNGKNIGKEKNLTLKEDDIVTIYIIGGTGYPGG
ncbi:MoaD/ThiS family protein [Deferribacter desulfuricans]|uniref:MoaD/ThiS family protein n=1 Tax=Deferribacter desulfuricans TaxID=197162 RepID=UPI0002EFA9EA|nr:MoaD/ThiS family protein [Deferribacter desulfuricans]